MYITKTSIDDAAIKVGVVAILTDPDAAELSITPLPLLIPDRKQRYDNRQTEHNQITNRLHINHYIPDGTVMKSCGYSTIFPLAEHFTLETASSVK